MPYGTDYNPNSLEHKYFHICLFKFRKILLQQHQIKTSQA